MANDFLTDIDAAAAAKQKAAAVGTNGHRPEPDHPLVGAALDRRIADLAVTPSGQRNDMLNKAAVYLGRFPIDRALLHDLLLSACQANGLLVDDGQAACDATIRSGFKKADLDGPRTIEDRTPNVTVTEVDATALQTPIPTETLTGIENGFWEASEPLKAIYNAALSRMCAPWTVLACCAARALYFVRPCIYLPPLIGGKGSLNWFAAIAAPSGGGKGSSLAVSRDLIPDFVYQRNLGSGEGLVTSYRCRPNDQHPEGERESVMFVADEIDSMTALGSRTGSTLMPILRSAFSGETLGFSYATKGRDVHLIGHTYRLTLVCSIQPGRAGALLSDGAGGTPQRFMWFPGLDKRITRRDVGEFIQPLELPPLKEWLYPREIGMPQEAKDLIVNERVRAMNGDGNSLDAHAIFSREKFAFALAVLDKRTEITMEDWELSGIAAGVSSMTRDWVTGQIREVEDREHTKRGRARGIELLAAEDEKNRIIYNRAEKVKELRSAMSLRILERLAEGRTKKRDLDRAMTNKGNREMYRSVMKELYDHKKIGWDKEGSAWFIV